MKRGIVIAAVLLVAAFLFLRTEMGQLITGNWSFTNFVREDDGTFFRLKVKLAYKGEPQDFDIVVACHVKVIGYKDGGSTYEAGLTPTVYGRRMSDGKGLVIRAPDACSGETTANGKVPPDFMPVVVVYDDANTLAFGTAYISDEAYESPLSFLKFGESTIEAATRAEFEDFRKNGPANLVTRESYHSIQNDEFLEKRGLKRVWPPFGRICYAVARFRIPEEARSAVWEYWPQNHPQYWSKPDFQTRAKLLSLVRNSYLQRDDGGEVRYSDAFAGGEMMMADNGVPNRQGGGMIERRNYPASFYPVSSERSANNWPEKIEGREAVLLRRTELTVARVDLKGGTARGFARCYLTAFIKTDLLKRLADASALLSYVDDNLIADAESDWLTAPDTFFERDEFFYLPYQFYLDSMRGDV